MGTVTIGCSLPSGFTMTVGEVSVVLKGGGAPDAIAVSLDKSYGLTRDVDEDFFLAWLAGVGENFAPYKSGAIIVQTKDDSVADEAKDMAKVKTGFEGLNPDGLEGGLEATPETKAEIAKTKK
jgi:hypothetical protein